MQVPRHDPTLFPINYQDSTSKAGLRLDIPSLSTPVGGLIADFNMSRWRMLSHLVQAGNFFMVLRTSLITTLDYYDWTWKYVAYLFQANLGHGIAYLSILLTNIAALSNLVSASLGVE
jgi:hypothetical protein